MKTKEKPKSNLPPDFDWTAHYYFRGEPTKALCGKDLLGIPDTEAPVCKECKRIRRERIGRG